SRRRDPPTPRRYRLTAPRSEPARMDDRKAPASGGRTRTNPARTRRDDRQPPPRRGAQTHATHAVAPRVRRDAEALTRLAVARAAAQDGTSLESVEFATEGRLCVSLHRTGSAETDSDEPLVS